jgi:hypothetical protein
MIRLPKAARIALMQLLSAGEVKVAEGARMLAVSPNTVWRWCRAAGIQPRAAVPSPRPDHAIIPGSQQVFSNLFLIRSKK